MPQAKPQKGFSHVLIVEDDAAQRRTLAEVLRNEGLDVVACGTAAAAMRHLQSRRIGVIVVDLRLPDLSGTDLLEKLSFAGSHTRFIVHTGYASLSSAKTAVHLKAFAYVEKSSDAGELVRFVHRALRERSEQIEQLAQRAADRQLRSLVEAAPDAMVIADDHGKIVLVNAQAERLFGYRREELLGKPVEILVPERFRGEHAARRADYFAHPRLRPTGADLALHAVRKNGSEFPVEIRLGPVESDDGWLVFAGIRDVSARKEAEQALRANEEALRESQQRLEETIDELRATQEQVIQQERLRALGEMAGGVAHDLNNSLSPVLGYAELLEDDPRLPDDVRRALKWICTGARDAAGIVARLQEFSRPSIPGEKRGPVQLKELLAEIVHLTRPRWRDEAQRTGRNIDLNLDLEDVPPVLAGKGEIREVMTNLVFNAVDALPGGGWITLGLRAAPENVVIEVRDTGVGMSEEARAKCFEPFFTTKSGAGAGLGLSVCHGIVQRIGGRIEIDSAVGQGTTVRVCLPVADESSGSDADEEGGSLPARRVLYIDDDPRLCPVMRDMLQKLGQEVDSAEGGAEGLEMLETGHYDLVITDLGMPDLDGAAVTRWIKATRPGLPVVVLTGWGSASPSAPREPGELADHVLAKPPTVPQLRAVLSTLLD